MQDDAYDLDLDRQLEAWAASHSGTQISPELARRVRQNLKPSLTPIKPVPSRGTLSLVLLAVFVAVSAGLVAVMNKTGLHMMTPLQLGGISTILVGGGILFATNLSGQMIPGSRAVVPIWVLLSLGGVAVFGGLATLFPWQTSGSFFSEGVPCAAMELALFVPAAAIFWLFARRGALFASAGLGTTLAGVAAFLVLMPLQVQCMFQQAPHLLVWHGGTALLMIGLGALVGNALRGRWVS
ncbi:MAG TPA: hypothetical protein VEV85_23220 [Bryobacteraceae bacterium]|nr:hypothetical protein [Bryobacteraceae bacterium]